MIIFSFIHYDLNLFELCREGRLDMADTANCLRLFFLDKFPHLEAPLNEVFQVGNILSPNIYINFKTLVDSYSGTPRNWWNDRLWSHAGDGDYTLSRVEDFL